MKNQVECLCIARRGEVLQVLYFCPRCESANEVAYPCNLRALVCRDCGQVNDATSARMQLGDCRDNGCGPEGEGGGD